MHSWCVESEKWVEICFHHWTSEKIPFLYFFLHKSWIWQTLGHVTKKNSYCHFHNAPKEYFWPKKILNFMHGFKLPFWQFFNSRESFFRKSPFCTFSCINPGFGGPWDMLWIFFLIGIFIMLQKNTFGQKNFKFHTRVQKCQFGKIERLPKWHFWTRALNSKFFFAKRLLLRHYESAIYKKYS